MPQNASKCLKMPQKASKVPQNASKSLKKPQKCLKVPQYASKVPQNASKCLKKPQNTVLGGIQVVSCAATPLTLRVASGYRGGVFFELTRD